MLFKGADAVNRPLFASMLPQEAVHVADTFAVNWVVNPCPVVTLAGVIAIEEVMVAIVDAV